MLSLLKHGFHNLITFFRHTELVLYHFYFSYTFICRLTILTVLVCTADALDSYGVPGMTFLKKKDWFKITTKIKHNAQLTGLTLYLHKTFWLCILCEQINIDISAQLKGIQKKLTSSAKVMKWWPSLMPCMLIYQRSAVPAASQMSILPQTDANYTKTFRGNFLFNVILRSV